MGEPQHEVRSGDRSGGRGGWIEMQSIDAGNQGSPHLCACRIQGRVVQKPITAIAGPLHRHRLLAAGHRHKERSQTVRQLRLAYICLCGRGRAGSEPSSVQRKEAASEHYCGVFNRLRSLRHKYSNQCSFGRRLQLTRRDYPQSIRKVGFVAMMTSRGRGRLSCGYKR